MTKDDIMRAYIKGLYDQATELRRRADVIEAQAVKLEECLYGKDTDKSSLRKQTITWRENINP